MLKTTLSTIILIILTLHLCLSESGTDSGKVDLDYQTKAVLRGGSYTDNCAVIVVDFETLEVENTYHLWSQQMPLTREPFPDSAFMSDEEILALTSAV